MQNCLETVSHQARGKELDRLISSLAGDNRFEGKLHRNGRNTLDWRRRLALRALGSTGQEIEEIIASYLEDTSKGLVPTPSPSHGASNGSQSVQFKVMRAMTASTPARLLDIVEPIGYTSFHNDTALSFHLASVLAGAIPLVGAADDFDKVCMNYASQLISENRWIWAVFVMLCIIPDSKPEARHRRVECAKSIVLRYSSFGDDAYVDSFLEQDIGVPSAWFAEALSNRALTVIDFVSHTLRFDPPAALQILETRYLPNVLFMNRGQVDDVKRMIEGMVAAKNSVAFGVFRFFSLAENLRRVKLRSDGDVPDTLNELFAEHDDLSRIFRDRLSSIRSLSLDYRFYVEYPMRVSLSSMLREALTHLADIRLQLVALAADAQGTS